MDEKEKTNLFSAARMITFFSFIVFLHTRDGVI